MHKYSCIVIFILLSTYVFAEKHKLQVWDKEGGTSVPYAEVSTENGVVAICDEDGVVSFEIDEKTLYTFSQMGYDSITIDGKRLLRLRRVELKEQPMHLNEAVVTADIALYDLKRAMDSTSKLIPKTQYMKNYSLHRVECNGELVLEIKAITVAKVIKEDIASVSMGPILVASERSGDGDLSPFSHSLKKPFDTRVTFYNNTFVFDVKTNRESYDFTYLNRLDSNAVISFYSKSEDRTQDGRFFLNTKNWTIQKIQHYIPEKKIDKYIASQRDLTKNLLLVNQAIGTLECDDNGNTTSVSEQISFMSRDDNNIEWSLNRVLSYEVISKKEYEEYIKNRKDYPKFDDRVFIYGLQDLNTHIISENSEKFKIK